MFDIYIKDFNKDGQLITEETLVQTIPAEKAGDLKITNPLVKTDLGNAESFTFGIEGGTKFYDAFNQMKTFMRVVYDGDTIFYGRILTIDNGFFGTRSLRCEGPLAFLNDSSIEGVKEESRPQKTINVYFQELIDNHNSQLNDSRRSFTLGEIPGLYTSAVSEDQQVVKNADVDKKKRKYGSDSWSDTKGLIEDLRSHYGGYLRVRCPGHQNGNKYVDEGHIIDWMNHYFSTGEISQTVEVGKNIIDISSSTEVDNIFTVVIPIGNTKTKTSETVDGEKKSTTPKHFYVEGREVTVPSICAKYGQALNSGYHTYDDYASALDRYGRIIKTVVFDDAQNATELLEKCQEWIKNNYQGEVTKFTVKAVDMHQIGDKSVSKIKVGDQVRLIYPVVKEDGSVEKKQLVRTCLSISYDLYNPENNSYTFGIPANILTKSYGVLKQAGNKDSASKPKSSSSGGSSRTRDWISQVTEWLATHKINYKHLSDGETLDTRVWPNIHFPYDGSRQYEKGPFGDHRDYFYDVEYSLGIGKFTLWKFTPIGQGEEFDQDELNKILQQVRDGMKGCPETAIQEARRYAEQAYKNSHTYTKWDCQLVTLNGVLSVQNVVECKIVEYVKQEYGIDLQTFNNIKMPEVTFTDANGVTQTYVPAEGSKVITKEMFKSDYTGEVPQGWHIINRTDTYIDQQTGKKTTIVRQIGSCQDDNGNWTYYIEDPDHPGVIIPTTIRDLKTESITTGNFIGTQISEGYYDETGHLHVYKMGQEIENWADGELVVARVDGDQVVIGSAERTSTIIEGALNNVSSVCGNYEVEVDPTTGERRVILHEGSGLFKRRNGIEFGLYDENNLTAGVVVNKINNGDTTVNITGDHIVIGTKSGSTISNTVRLMATNELEQGLYRVVNIPGQGAVPVLEAGNRIKRTKDGVTGYYGIWDSSGQEIQGGLVVEKINGQTNTYLRGDRVVVGNAQTNSSVMEALKTAKVITSDTLQPQALVTSAVYTTKINAVEGRLNTLETDYLKTSYLTSEESALAKIYFKELWGNSIRSNSISSTNIYIRRGLTPYGSDDNWNIKNFIAYVQVIPSGDDYKLQYKDFDDEDWKDAGTFNRAATVQGDWSGGVYTVTPKIGKIKENISTRLNGIFSVNGTSPRKNGGSPKYIGQEQRVTYYAPNPAGTGELYIDTGFTQDVWINAGLVYNDGWAAASDKVSLPTAQNTGTQTLTIGYPNKTDVDGTALTRDYILAEDGNNAVRLYTNVTISGATVQRNVAKITHGKYDAGRTNGWTSAYNKVSLPTAQNTGTQTLTIGYPPSTLDGTALTRDYILAEDGNNAVRLYTNVTISGATVQRNVAKITHNQYSSGQTSGWNLAYGKVSVPTSGSSASITVKYPTSTYDSSSSTTYTISDDGNNAVKLSTTISGVSVPVAKYTHNQYSSGQTSGWNLAYGKVSVPTSGSSASITVSYPTSTYNSSSSTTYTISDDGNNAVKLSTTISGVSVPVAKYTHNKYRDGYAAGQASSATFSWQNDKCYASSYLTPQVRGDDGELHTCTRVSPLGSYSTLRIGSETKSIRIVFKIGSTEYFYYMSVELV